MAIRLIRTFEDPALRKACKPVKIMTPRLRELAEDMFETMYDAGGVGLAAPQVGILKQIVVMDCGMEEPEPIAMVNPEIILADGEQTGDEGCLSFPGYQGTVTRAEHVIVRFLNLEMEECELEANGLLARCIQHETDHLHGQVYVDKVEGELRKSNAAEEEEEEKEEEE